MQACRLIASNFTIKWTPSQVFFGSISRLPILPPCIDLSPPMFSTPVVNPEKDMPIFNHAHPVTVKVTFSFLEYILACKNSARFSHSLKFRVPCPFLTTATQKLLKYIILNFLEFASAWKISSIHPFTHPFTLWPGWPQPFLATPLQYFSINSWFLVSTCKKVFH